MAVNFVACVVSLLTCQEMSKLYITECIVSPEERNTSEHDEHQAVLPFTIQYKIYEFKHCFCFLGWCSKSIAKKKRTMHYWRVLPILMDLSQQKDTLIKMHFFTTHQPPSIDSILNLLGFKQSFFVVFSEAYSFLLTVNIKLCINVLLQFNVFVTADTISVTI